MLDRSLALRLKSIDSHIGARAAEARALFFLSVARRLDRRRVYDEASNVVETHKHAGDFKEW